ncbi:MAG: D-alanyl-D-alanine carboxypeptidase/D-alanyl-D-alanine-endopeptidase [Prevotella sp.]|nr:D-alanyl-D-alanine carboxypeptidase/D-alanyl-D-alanine-endopeptidase [Prevotella sp.]
MKLRDFILTCLVLLSPVAMTAQEFDQTREDSVMTDSLVLVHDMDSLLSADNDLLEWPANIQERIGNLLHHDMFQTSQVGLMVYDLTADSVIFCHNERQLMRPASTMKMVTAVAAIDCLGSSYQLKTQLRYSGTVSDKTLVGNIYCIGGLDPRFNNDDMRAFVESLRKMDIDTIRGKIVADVSMKDRDLLGEGWCWDDKNPVLSPLLVNRKDNFMETFISMLTNTGIYLDITTDKGTAPHGTFELCTRTHTIDQILQRMMKKSDNLYAEALFYQIAAQQGSRYATAKQAAAAIKRLINKIGLNASDYRIADGSGLSLYNYLTPEVEVGLLKYAWNNEDIYYYLYNSMPIAGQDGTLQNRMRGTHAAGNVRAKTGTVTGVSSLAGYCTSANGHELCFAIINNGLLSTSKGRMFQDRVCQALCAP